MVQVRIVGPLSGVDGDARDGDVLRFDVHTGSWRRATIRAGEQEWYGDILSAASRESCTCTSELRAGFWSVMTALARVNMRVSSLRLYTTDVGIPSAGQGDVAVQVQIRDATVTDNQPVLSTVAVTATQLGEVGTPAAVKEFPLATPFDLVSGRRYALWLYLPAGVFDTVPQQAAQPLACSEFTGLMSPAGQPSAWRGASKAATQPLPAVAGVDGTWNADPDPIWWALS